MIRFCTYRPITNKLIDKRINKRCYPIGRIDKPGAFGRWCRPRDNRTARGSDRSRHRLGHDRRADTVGDEYRQGLLRYPAHHHCRHDSNPCQSVDDIYARAMCRRKHRQRNRRVELVESAGMFRSGRKRKHENIIGQVLVNKVTGSSGTRNNRAVDLPQPNLRQRYHRIGDRHDLDSRTRSRGDERRDQFRRHRTIGQGDTQGRCRVAEMRRPQFVHHSLDRSMVEYSSTRKR